MRVGDLLEILEQIAEEDGEDVEVLIMTQESWPFECSIQSVRQRRDIEEDEADEVHLNNGTSPSDVFLVEGKQLRYGSKKAWDR